MATSEGMRGLLAFLLFLVSSVIIHAAQISLPPVSTGPGSSVFVAAVFDPGADIVSGLQFDLQYDGSSLSLVSTAGDSVRSAGKSVYFKDLSPNKRRFLVVGLNQNPIPAGSLINIFVFSSVNAANGIQPITFSNILSVNPAGQPVQTSGTDGSVNVDGTMHSQLQPEGVLNAASLNSGPVAPGEVITLIGSGIGPAISQQPASGTSKVLGDTSVLFDGKPAPLLYAGLNQINAIVPYGVSGQNVTEVSLSSGSQLIAGFPLSASAAAPAIFTADASGVGPGAILNQDTSLNSALNPADRGSIVVIFATGAGQTDPPGIDGQITGSVLPQIKLPVSVKIGGIDAEILYSGAAPGLVAGVLQVNCRVPDSVVSGSVPIALVIGGFSSAPGVSLAVR